MFKLEKTIRAVPLTALAVLLACNGASGDKQTAAEESGAQAMAAQTQSAAVVKAPEFSLEKIEGGRISLSELKGNVVIVDFWATWCPPCVKEIPEFIELYKTYNSQGFVMVGISVDRGGPGVVKQFVEKNSVNYPVVMADMDVVNAYEVFAGIPTTFIIDRQGNIVEKVIGYQSKDFFEEHIKKLL